MRDRGLTSVIQADEAGERMVANHIFRLVDIALEMRRYIHLWDVSSKSRGRQLLEALTGCGSRCVGEVRQSAWRLVHWATFDAMTQNITSLFLKQLVCWGAFSAAEPVLVFRTVHRRAGSLTP